MIKAILFDMDGVLIDAKDWHYEALNDALAVFGMSISRYDHLHTFDGLPTREKLKLLSEQYYLPDKLHPFINELKQRNTLEIASLRCAPIFCHEYALSHLKNEGYKIAVCSNSIRATIEFMLGKAALLQYVDLIISNQDVKKTKPDPEMYNTAIKEFELNSENCLVVEDNPKGIEAGKASGAYVLAVDSVNDVNYENIKRMIAKCEGKND